MRTLLLGDIGNRLDIADTEQDIRQLRRASRQTSERQHRRDEDQDARLEALERRSERLELCVGTLGRLLVAAGTLDEAALADMIERLERSEPEDDAQPS